jgi:hypothetical protein
VTKFQTQSQWDHLKDKNRKKFPQPDKSDLESKKISKNPDTSNIFYMIPVSQGCGLAKSTQDIKIRTW